MCAFRNFALIGLLCGASLSVFAQSDPNGQTQKCTATLLQPLGAQLSVARFTQSDKGVVVSAACKVWPKDTTKTIVAVGYSTKVESEKGFVVAVVETATGKAVSLSRNKIEEDDSMKLRYDSLSIDTAKYDLTSEVRAFGVNITSGASGPNCRDGGTGSERSLYVQDGKNLKRVLERLSITDWQFVSGGMCLGGNAGKTATIIEELPASIAIAKTATNGYYDLVITRISKLDNGAKSKRQPFQYILKFDGQRYSTDSMEKAYWKWRN